MSKIVIPFAVLIAVIFVSSAPAFAKRGGNGAEKVVGKTQDHKSATTSTKTRKKRSGNASSIAPGAGAGRPPGYTGVAPGAGAGRPPGYTGNGAGAGAGRPPDYTGKGAGAGAGKAAVGGT